MNTSTLLLLLITAVASGSAIFFIKIGTPTLKLILAFSGAFLLGITSLHLIPEVYAEATVYTGLFVLAGFLLQILIEYFSEGIEHGHIHVHAHEEQAFPVTMMIALSVHSFIEGMPLAGNSSDTRDSLSLGIILHNIPIAIALTSMLIQSGLKRSTALIWLIVFASMSPLGAFAGQFWVHSHDAHQGHSHFMDYSLALVVGIFLHVSTTILFESNEHHRFHFKKLLVILAGMGLAIGLSLATH